MPTERYQRLSSYDGSVSSPVTRRDGVTSNLPRNEQDPSSAATLATCSTPASHAKCLVDVLFGARFVFDPTILVIP